MFFYFFSPSSVRTSLYGAAATDKEISIEIVANSFKDGSIAIIGFPLPLGH